MTTAIESAYAKETAATSCPCKKKEKRKKELMRECLTWMELTGIWSHHHNF
jgi:hypothetical protein